MLSQQHKRDLEATAAKEQQARLNEFFREGALALKLAGKRYLGIPVTGNDSHGLQDLLASFSGEQIDAAVTTGTVQLTPAQQQTLLASFASLAENEAKKLEPPKPEAAE